MPNFEILEKGLRIVSPLHFAYDFQENTSHVTFIKLDVFHCLTDFTSCEIAQYVTVGK